MVPQEATPQRHNEALRAGLPDGLVVLDRYWDGYGHLLGNLHAGDITIDSFRRYPLTSLVGLDGLRAKAEELGEERNIEVVNGSVETSRMRNGVRYVASHLFVGSHIVQLQYWKSPTREEGPEWEKVHYRPRSEMVKFQDIHGKNLRSLLLEVGDGWYRLESNNMRETPIWRRAVELNGKFRDDPSGEMVEANIRVRRPALHLQ